MNPYRLSGEKPLGPRWGTRRTRWWVKLFRRRVRCFCHGKMVRKDRAWFGGWGEWWCNKSWVLYYWRNMHG